MAIELPVEISILLKTWDSSSTMFLILGYGLVGIGILCSLAVGAFAATLDNKYIKILGFVSAACTALLAAYHPIDVGNAFRDAWRIMNAASLEYKIDESKRVPQTLVGAMREGESIIARSQGANQTSSGKPVAATPASSASK